MRKTTRTSHRSCLRPDWNHHAWDRGYIGLALLKAITAALLAILLWWLVLLGVNLDIH